MPTSQPFEDFCNNVLDWQGVGEPGPLVPVNQTSEIEAEVKEIIDHLRCYDVQVLKRQAYVVMALINHELESEVNKERAVILALMAYEKYLQQGLGDEGGGIPV